LILERVTRSLLLVECTGRLGCGQCRAGRWQRRGL
jgi:hypothetical protein